MRYEKYVRILNDEYMKTLTPTLSISSTKLGIAPRVLMYLAYKGLITIKLYNDIGYEITLLPNCIFYFEEKHDHFVKDIFLFFSRFLSGFASGVLVGVAIAYFTRMLF